MTGPRLVCVTPYVPGPDVPHAGGVLLHRRLTALRPLCADVTVVAPETAEHRRAAAGAAFPTLLLQPDAVPPGRAGTALGLLRAAAGQLDPLVPRLRASLAHSAEAAEVLRAADVVEVHWGEYLPLLPVLRRLAPSATTGVLLHDVVSQAKRGRARNPLVWAPERWALRLGAAALEHREVRLLQAADLVFVLKEQDRDALQDRGLERPVHLARPGLDLPDPAPGPAEEPVALFVVAMWR